MILMKINKKQLTKGVLNCVLMYHKVKTYEDIRLIDNYRDIIVEQSKLLGEWPLGYKVLNAAYTANSRIFKQEMKELGITNEEN